ncbi:MAG TPA: hypothetical protein VIN03_13870 [Roseateles sp.]
MHIAKKNVDLFLTGKREGKALRRRHLQGMKRDARARAAEHQALRRIVFGSDSLIAEMLSRSPSVALAMPQTSLRVPLPSKFSMFSSPAEVLRLISAFALVYRSKPISDVYVDFSKISLQDLGAHGLLDKLVDEIQTQTRFRQGKLRWSGNFPRDAAQKRFVRAMGIIRQLGLKKFYLPIDDQAKIVLFERRCKHYLRAMRKVSPFDKTEQANAAEKFVDYVNGCLARENQALTETARAALCSYVVEILDNAENHAGMVDWTIQGYLDTAADTPECEIVIFNFGKSIYESMSTLAPDSFMGKKIKAFLDKQALAGAYLNSWRKDELVTLYALQEAVSSQRDSLKSTRGKGTADLIEFFQRMSDERQLVERGGASMYIISGGTRIVFDGRYRMARDDKGVRKIAFNKENDLDKLPDPSCVMPLKDAFLPGTMIGIRFPIEAPSLVDVEEASA